MQRFSIKKRWVLYCLVTFAHSPVMGQFTSEYIWFGSTQSNWSDPSGWTVSSPQGGVCGSVSYPGDSAQCGAFDIVNINTSNGGALTVNVSGDLIPRINQLNISVETDLLFSQSGTSSIYIQPINTISVK